jgi:chemotaxis protein methyltransferase CheR
VISIQPEELKVLTRFIYEQSGISLDESKAYLLESRLSGLMRDYNCGAYSELYFKAKSDATKVLPRKIVEAMTTNETSFFRDTAPFELLRHKLIPELIDRQTKTTLKGLPIPIRIWSAACSTGQEVYSIATVLRELLGDWNRWSIRLLGTDISDQAVARASRGIYTKFEMERGLASDQLNRWFTPVPDGWKIRDEVRAAATFKTLNLMQDFSGLGKFDIIFCRNVAIYFTEQDKTRLFNRLGAMLAPEGALIIGSTETLAGLCPQFESKRYLRTIFYQLKA